MRERFVRGGQLLFSENVVPKELALLELKRNHLLYNGEKYA